MLATRPTPMDIDQPITDEAWAAYYRDVWAARLDAQMEHRYWLEMRRMAGAVGFLLQFTVTLASSSAVIALLANAERTVVLVVAAVAAACSIGLQITRVPEKIRKTESLVEAWAARANFWDEAWRLVLGGHHLGSLADLKRDEVALERQRAELGLPSFMRMRRRIMDEVERADMHSARAPA